MKSIIPFVIVGLLALVHCRLYAHESISIWRAGEELEFVVSKESIFLRLFSVRDIQGNTITRDEIVVQQQAVGQEILISRHRSLSGRILSGSGLLNDIAVHDLIEANDGVRSPVYTYEGRQVLPTGYVLVKFTDAIEREMVGSICSRLQAEEVPSPEFLRNCIRLKLTSDSPDAFAVSELLQTHDAVEWAEAELAYEIELCTHDVIPDDPYFEKQAYLRTVELPQAWGLSTGSNQIIVAVIDDGIDFEYPDLKSKIVAGYDFVDNDQTAQSATNDCHGSFCAAIIAAASNNSVGLAGIAWHARIMPVRICGPSRYVTDATVAEAIVYAAAHGAKLILCAWGGGPPSRQITEALDTATAAGSLVVAASGNASRPKACFLPGSI